MARTLIRASPQVVFASRRAAGTGHRVVVCVDCIGDRRLYATTATRPPALGERCSRCGEEAKLGPEIRRVCME